MALVICDTFCVGIFDGDGFLRQFPTGFSGNHGQCDFRASLTQLAKIHSPRFNFNPIFGKIIEGKKATGTFMYVLDMDGHIVFGERRNPYNSKGRSPHPTLIGGKDPVVQAAGLMNMQDGKILSFDDQSGHFRPSSKSMDKVATALRKLYNKNHNLFSDEFNWRKQ